MIIQVADEGHLDRWAIAIRQVGVLKLGFSEGLTLIAPTKVPAKS
jgi:hypothetical protein